MVILSMPTFNILVLSIFINMSIILDIKISQKVDFMMRFFFFVRL